uniref:F-box and leucine-rich protein 22 isoform X3 n=1 Tax=Pristiophorus japonicus TaxID=55135 RepID=UPI00398EE0F9
MQLTELNRECLLHIFSFLDKANRKSLSRTCRVLREVFLEPALWSLLCFSSPSDLRKDNFVLSPALRSLSICWHSSRVKVCNIEDWMKSSFQRDICNRHSNLVNSFLLQISDSSASSVSPGKTRGQKMGARGRTPRAILHLVLRSSYSRPSICWARSLRTLRSLHCQAPAGIQPQGLLVLLWPFPPPLWRYQAQAPRHRAPQMSPGRR